MTDTLPVPTNPAATVTFRQPPATAEELLFRLLDEISSNLSPREEAVRMRTFIQVGLGELRSAVMRREIEDDELEDEIHTYVDDATGRLQELVLPEGASPFIERARRVVEGVHPAEQWDLFYEAQVAVMSADVSLVQGYLSAAGILRRKVLSLEDLVLQEEKAEGIRLTRRQQREIQEDIEHREAEADGGEKEPQRAHGEDEGQPVPDPELRSGKGWVVVDK